MDTPFVRSLHTVELPFCCLEFRPFGFSILLGNFSSTRASFGNMSYIFLDAGFIQMLKVRGPVSVDEVAMKQGPKHQPFGKPTFSPKHLGLMFFFFCSLFFPS